MQVEVERITGWQLVADAARMTIHKDSIGKEPSDKFKKSILLAQHSPIRMLQFKIVLRDIPYYVSVHLVRHFMGVEKFVTTQRDDRFPDTTPRAEKPQGALVSMMMVCNAEALINISKKRLCCLADPMTIKLWNMVKDAVSEVDPIMGQFMVRECVYRGRCPEIKSCGFADTVAFLREREVYGE